MNGYNTIHTTNTPAVGEYFDWRHDVIGDVVDIRTSRNTTSYELNDGAVVDVSEDLIKMRFCDEGLENDVNAVVREL